MTITGAALALALGVTLEPGEPGPPGPEPAAADVVTLRDGRSVSGEVIEPSARGPVKLYVRRAWARENVPGWADRWEAAEAPTARRALAQRRARLEAWARDRAAFPVAGGGDRITPWVERERDRLRAGDPAPLAVMAVTLPRADVTSVARGAKGGVGLLRLGWVSGFPDAESMGVASLKAALEGRGFDVSAAAARPAPIDALLPLPAETEHAFLVRRAATEVLHDPGLKFVHYQGLVLPEPEGGGTADAAGALGGLSGLMELLNAGGAGGADPLAGRLRGVGARGRVGAVVTTLDVAPDAATVRVELALWVRRGDGGWGAAGTRAALVRPGDLGPGAGKELADDPQVATAFRLAEALGLGSVAADLKQKSLAVGAATRKALGEARSAAQADLAGLALPVLDAPPGPKPAPGG